MFDIGWSELVVIGIVALIAIGPKELPGVLRSLGYWMGKVRRMAAEFQDQFRDAMREAEVADLKKQLDEMKSDATGLVSGFDNPLDLARREMEKAVGDKPLAGPEAFSIAKPEPGTDEPVKDEPATALPSGAPAEEAKDETATPSRSEAS